MQPTRGDYYGPTANRCARIADVANGDQIYVSAEVAKQLGGHELTDLGLVELRGIGPRTVFQVHRDGFVADDRAPRVMAGRSIGWLPSPSASSLARLAASRVTARPGRLRLAHEMVEAIGGAAADLLTTDESATWSWLDGEWNYVRAAVDTLLDADELEAAATMVLDLGTFAALSLRAEVFAWAESILESSAAVQLQSHAPSLLGLRALNRYFAVDPGSRSAAEQGLAIDPADPYGYCRLGLGAVWMRNAHTDADTDAWTRAGIDSLAEDSPLQVQLWAHTMRAFYLSNFEPDGEEIEKHTAAVLGIANSTGSVSALAMSQFCLGLGGDLDHLRAAQDTAATLHPLHLVGELAQNLELHRLADAGAGTVLAKRCYEALRTAYDNQYLAGASHLLGVSSIALARVGHVDVARSLLRSMQASGHVPRANAIDAAGGSETLVGVDALSIHDAVAHATTHLHSTV